jgi:hypothetical protein
MHSLARTARNKMSNKSPALQGSRRQQGWSKDEPRAYGTKTRKTAKPAERTYESIVPLGL